MASLRWRTTARRSGSSARPLITWRTSAGSAKLRARPSLREEGDRDELGREGFGRGDADLEARAGVDDAVGLAGQGAADHIADGDRAGALVLGLAEGRQGIGGFPG